MENSGNKMDRPPFNRNRRVLVFLLSLGIMVFAALVFYKSNQSQTPNVTNAEAAQSTEDWNRIEDGIHVRTGLKEDEGLMTVVTHCTACHSAQLVIQNRMNEERWNATIRWMQETQNLWDLGENQKVIVDYLVRNYPPTEKGRRENLKNIEWYELEEN